MVIFHYWVFGKKYKTVEICQFLFFRHEWYPTFSDVKNKGWKLLNQFYNISTKCWQHFPKVVTKRPFCNENYFCYKIDFSTKCLKKDIETSIETNADPYKIPVLCIQLTPGSLKKGILKDI